MGSADIIPGVSGGTIALVLGIYRKLIDSLKSFNPQILLQLIKFDIASFKEGVKKIRLDFLLPLFSGVVLAILLGSKLIHIALNRFPGPTYSFFSGLIIASALMIFNRYQRNVGAFMTMIAGILIGFFLAGLSSFALTHQLYFIFISGAVAVCAMILPGVSGAFLLLLLGQYEYMLGLLHQPFSSIHIIGVFILGAVFGLVSFTRIISYFMDNYEKETLGFLVGLMAGSLRRPIGLIIEGTSLNGPTLIQNFSTLFFTILFGILGILLVYLLNGSFQDRI